MENNENNVTPAEKNNNEISPVSEKVGYKISTIVLSVALVASLSVFLFIRYMERKSAEPPVVETLATLETAITAETETVDINTADVYTLQTLPGIGQARAEAIIEYRLEYGRFDSAEDIMKVPGIGQSLYDGIAEYIYAS